MSEQPTITDRDEPIGTGSPDSEATHDVQGHSLLHQGLHRPTATSRNAERPTSHSGRTPCRDPQTRRGDR